MKILSIAEIISYTKARIESTEVLWRGRTIYILSALGVCLVYLLRGRLKEIVFGVPQNGPLRDRLKGSEIVQTTALGDSPKVTEVVYPTDDSYDIDYRSLKREGISLQLHLETLIAQLSKWKITEEASPLWAKRQHFGKGVIVDLTEQIERICQGRRHNPHWDACKKELDELLQIENGKAFCAALKTLLETLLDLNEKRLARLEAKLGVVPIREFESYEEYLDYLLPADSKDVREELSQMKIEKEQIKEIRRKSFDGEWRKLRMHVGSKLEEKLKKNAPIYTELDLLYRIIKPLEIEIRQLKQELAPEPYAQEAVKKLTTMMTFIYLLDSENFEERIKRIEVLDKERQISQLRNYQRKTQEAVA
jgi:hypothetical protein